MSPHDSTFQKNISASDKVLGIDGEPLTSIRQDYEQDILGKNVVVKLR